MVGRTPWLLPSQVRYGVPWSYPPESPQRCCNLPLRTNDRIFAMPENRLDTLARALAGATSRRGVLRALLGGAAGSVLAPAGVIARRDAAPAVAASVCCDEGLANCSGTCVNTQSDVSNCAYCAHACPAAASGSSRSVSTERAPRARAAPAFAMASASTYRRIRTIVASAARCAAPGRAASRAFVFFAPVRRE